jgi:hypothetical protein
MHESKTHASDNDEEEEENPHLAFTNFSAAQLSSGQQQ